LAVRRRLALAKHAFTSGTAAPASIAKAVERPARHGISAFGDPGKS